MTELNYTVVGYEYPSDEASKAVYETLLAEGKECSVWRTTTPAMDRWFILCVFSGTDYLSTVDWGEGVPFKLAPAQEAWCVERRLKRGLAAVLTGEDHVNETKHYEPSNAPRMPGSRP